MIDSSMLIKPAGHRIKRLLLLLFLLIGIPLLAQTSEQGTDPRPGNIQIDSSTINRYLEQVDSLTNVNQQDSAIALSIRVIELAEDINYDVAKAEGFKRIGTSYYYQSNFDQAEEYWKRSLAVFRSIGDTTGISNMQNNLGVLFLNKGDDKSALEYFIPSAQNAQIVRDTFRMGSAYLNIGSVYSNDADSQDQAEANYLLARDMFRALNSRSENPRNTRGIQIATANLGEIYLNRKQPREAIRNLEESVEAARDIQADVAGPMNWLAEAYVMLGDYDRADELYNQAILEAQAGNYKLSESNAYIGIGKSWLARERYRQAIENLEKGRELAVEIGVLREQQDAVLGIANSYAGLNNFREAFIYMEQYDQLRDSLRSADSARELQKLQVEFETEQKEKEIELLNAQNELNQVQIMEETRAKNLLKIILILFIAIIAGFIFQYFYIRKTNKRLAFERNRSDQILLNILPKETADELKERGFIRAKEFDSITVLFTDFKAFSVVAERISAEKLVKSVDYFFKNFDAIIEKHNLEKIKTIGDAYMCAGGIPTPNQTNAEDAFNAAVDIITFVKEVEWNPPKDIYPFKVRVGMNSGPVVAGVVGTKKFAYDIWGNTVNIASRMESNSTEGRLNVSENIYQQLRNKHRFSFRGEVEVKNGQILRMYYAELEDTVPEEIKSD